MKMRIGLAVIILALAGCVAAVKTVVTAPFKVVGKAADLATTSQAEADRNRGRDARKADEKAARDRKRNEKQARHEHDDEGN